MDEHVDEQVALEIAHILYLDIVGYSKLPSKEQRAAVDALNAVVRASEQFQKAEATDRLLKIPTGDGMALVFYSSPEAPAKCAVEVSRGLKAHPWLPLRMGMHSGSVTGVVDVNGRPNLAGAGLNIAQRVMDCGDAGHILISKNAADDLHEYDRWRPLLHSLGTCEVKHGVKLQIVNLCNDAIGNPQIPTRIRAQRRGIAKKRIGLAAALVLFGAVAFSYSFFFNHGRSASSAAPAKSIAVLPFKPLLPENRDPVLEFGMADTLITKLSTSRELIVPSLGSVRQVAGAEQEPRTIGARLQVASVLEGNVQRVGDRLRVTVRLIKVTDGSSLWAATFNEKFTDVFAVQDTIAQKVAQALALQLSGPEKNQITKRYTDNIEAYQLYITGRYHWSNLSPPELQKSIEFFKQAIAADPGYALAYYGLAESLRASSINSDMPPNEVMPQATAAARQAIELDPTLAEPHVTLAMIHQFYDWNWAQAEKEATRAIALNPNLAWAHMAYAHYLSDVGRHEEAIAAAARARELEPVSLILNSLEGARFYYARQYDEAQARLQKVLELNPNFWVAHRYLGNVAIANGNYPEAVAQFSKAKELARGNTQPPSMLAYIAARTGDAAKARAMLQDLKALSARRYVPSVNIAVVHLGLGETDEALRWLEKAFEEHDVQLQFLKVDPTWDRLRSHPRFVALLQRLGLSKTVATAGPRSHLCAGTADITWLILVRAVVGSGAARIFWKRVLLRSESLVAQATRRTNPNRYCLRRNETNLSRAILSSLGGKTATPPVAPR